MVDDLFEAKARDSQPVADSGGRGVAHAAPPSARAPSYPSPRFFHTPHPAPAPSHLQTPQSRPQRPERGPVPQDLALGHESHGPAAPDSGRW